MPTSSQASIDDPPGDPESDKGYRAPSSPSNSWSSGETQVPGQDGFKLSRRCSDLFLLLLAAAAAAALAQLHGEANAQPEDRLEDDPINDGGRERLTNDVSACDFSVNSEANHYVYGTHGVRCERVQPRADPCHSAAVGGGVAASKEDAASPMAEGNHEASDQTAHCQLFEGVEPELASIGRHSERGVELR